MRNGARLYAALQPHYPLFDGMIRTPVCFETFPHAIACELTGEIPPKHEKVHRRREILEAAGVATARLSNVDLRDAALCALTAHALLSRRFVMYGHEDDGFIIVPKRPRHSVVLPVPA
jgi:predicted RNase H-like nuclease